ncbi:hypothetical protein [Piscinibacter sakaiensis]|uniref:COG4648 family protein n=1 Tax=Piscinibacter sakaiensis TaxID=1547922 RepID=UPI003AAEF9D8
MAAWRIAVGLLAIAAWIGLSHWLTLHSGSSWALAAWIAPIWLAGLVWAVRRRSIVGIAGLLLLAAAVALVVARGGFGDVRHLYLLQHVGIHFGLGVMFANTLRGDSVSLIGRVATRVHGSLTAEMLAYTRQVTKSWVIYFFAMALLSVAVYLLASWTVWSALANIVTPLLIGALFVGEFLLRYRLHPEFERTSLLDAARAYQATPR